MNDLFLLQPEYQYRAERTRQEMKPVRSRRWLRHLRSDRITVTNEKNWIS